MWTLYNKAFDSFLRNSSSANSVGQKVISKKLHPDMCLVVFYDVSQSPLKCLNQSSRIESYSEESSQCSSSGHWIFTVYNMQHEKNIMVRLRLVTQRHQGWSHRFVVVVKWWSQNKIIRQGIENISAMLLTAIHFL